MQKNEKSTAGEMTLAQWREKALNIAKEELAAAITPYFQKMGIDTEMWGKTPGTRSFDDFITAMARHDIRMEYELGSKTFEIDTLILKMRYRIGDRIWELRKISEEYPDGREQQTTYPSYLFSNITGQETSYTAALRCLSEIEPKINWFDKLDKFSITRDRIETFEPQASPEYPGLSFTNNQRVLICAIHSESLYSEQYFVVVNDIKNYYGWMELDLPK
ncbi:MAG TPA: hypothetical protein VL335_02320 [Candidatus Paceibacterota bacterium]|nr:hypothetical protein [Candidatus Paceibacterota bacterium]